MDCKAKGKLKPESWGKSRVRSQRDHIKDAVTVQRINHRSETAPREKEKGKGWTRGA